MGGWSAEEEDDGDKEDKGKVMEMVEANKESKEGGRKAPLLLNWFDFLSFLNLLLHPKNQFIHLLSNVQQMICKFARAK